MTGFAKFYKSWFDELRRLVDQLYAARNNTTCSTSHHEQVLNQLLNRIMNHYSEYYRVKSTAIEVDVFTIFAAPWASSLERSLHWIAGWRPTTVFHLIYTESSILFESHILEILRGVRTGDLGDLSPAQFRRVSELQCETVKEENSITNELSDWQDIGATELMRDSPELNDKTRRLVNVVQKADDLRLRTIRRVVDLLTTKQAVEFLIAAAELQFGIRHWGINRDNQHGNA